MLTVTLTGAGGRRRCPLVESLTIFASISLGASRNRLPCPQKTSWGIVALRRASAYCTARLRAWIFLVCVHRSFRGQLTPRAPHPTDGAEYVAEESGIYWQRGPFQSWWLRLGVGGRMLPPYQTLVMALDEVFRRGEAAPNPGAAVYVGVQELACDSTLLGLLRARGFRFHHFHKSEADGASSDMRPGEFIYYRWMGDPTHDMVPSYSTSIEGVGAVCLSPDESKVLLIWEYGNWKPVTGAVDPAESKLDSLARELREEVGSKLDASFVPRYVGGWQLCAARDKLVNDNFSAFAVRAVSEQLTLDNTEVTAAHWFDCDHLLKLWRAEGSPEAGSQIVLSEADDHPSLVGMVASGRVKVATNALQWLDAYKSGRTLPVRTQKQNEHSTWVRIGGTE